MGFPSKKRARPSDDAPRGAADFIRLVASGSLSSKVSREEDVDRSVLENSTRFTPSQYDYANPKWIAEWRTEASETAALRGVSCSPDGTCALTSARHKLTVFELGEHAITPALSSCEAESVNDYAWYPGMRSDLPETCVFAAVSKGSPVHLWDAYASQTLRASYTLQSDAMEPMTAYSVSMTRTKLVAGLDSAIVVWDLARPGEPSARRRTVPTRARAREGLSGIISCLETRTSVDSDAEDSRILACGTFSGQVGLLDIRARTASAALVTRFAAQAGGVTRVRVSPCGRYVWSGGRRSNWLQCWDVRGKENELVDRIERIATDNHRVDFVVTSALLVTGEAAPGRGASVWETRADAAPRKAASLQPAGQASCATRGISIVERPDGSARLVLCSTPMDAKPARCDEDEPVAPPPPSALHAVDLARSTDSA